jgi:foldase protein PrsA
LLKARAKYLIFSVGVLIIISVIVFTGSLSGHNREVVARVNGEAIKKAELNQYLNLIYLYWPAYQEIFSEGEQAEEFEQEMLWLLVENKILKQEIKRIGLEIDEEEIEKRTRETREELINNIYNTEEEYAARLQELGLKETTLGLIFRDVQMRNLLYKHIGDGVTENDARQFVEEHPDFLEKAPRVHAFHILVDTEEEAEEIIQLLDGGADFVELGMERSKDQHVELGTISSDINFDPLFLEAAFALEPGEVSLPVETSFGFHVIKITDKEEAGVLAFEDVQGEITEMCKQVRFQEYFDELIKDTPVETF